MSIITLTDLKSYLNITGTTEDTHLTIIVNGVNTAINNYVGRELESDEYSEVYDGPGTDALLLKHFPVTAITEVLLKGQEIEEWTGWGDDDWESSSNEYYMKDDGSAGILYNRYCWPNGRAIISIQYTAGYETIPADIYLGTLQLAAYWRNITQPSRIGIVSEYLGAYNINTMSSLSATNFDLSIADPVFRMVLDQERAKSAREFIL